MNYVRLPFYCLILLLTGSLSSLQVKGQSIANYAAVRSVSVPYSSIASSGSAVPAWRYSGGYSQDDNRSYFIPVGFDFWYNGIRYDEVSVSTNGFVDFSSSTDDGGPTADAFGFDNDAFTAVAAATATRPALAVFYDDLTAQGGTQALGISIKHQLTGTAPNRIFTLEWINMAVYQNTSPSLNFQVRIHETSGVIQYNYGTMINGTHTFSYSVGLNATLMNAAPTPAQLKMQQTANGNSFTNGVQNNLAAVPATDTRITFTPPVPANPTGVITFSGVTQTSVTLSWNNWATNEVGYVVYNSTDGVNYNFVTQTFANVTSTNINGLNPSQTYNWRIYAVTEGALSNPLDGIQATQTAGNRVSNVVNGNWNSPGSWLPVGIPSATDNVTILNGHTITVNANATCYFLTVGQGISGTLLLGNSGTSRDLTINGNLSVRAGASLLANTGSNTTHDVNVYGNIQNDGTIDFNTDANSHAAVNFLKNGNQTVSGTGTTNDYYAVDVNMGSSYVNTVDITASVFTAPNGFLTLTNGTFKLSSANAFTNTLTTGALTIGVTQGLWINNPNATVTFGNTVTIDGLLRMTNGTMNIGDAANENLISNGGEINVQGGTLNVAGLYNSTGLNNLSIYKMSGGTINLATVGTTNTITSPFNISSPGSEIVMTGGTIVIQREGGNGAQDLGYRVINTSNSTVSGGTLQLGSTLTPATQVMRIETDLPVGNLLVNSANARARLQSLGLTARNNVTVQSGILDLNNLMLTFGGNWTDNGTFIPGTATVLFDGNTTRFVTDPDGEIFTHLTVGGTGALQINNTISTTGDLTINSTLDAGPSNNTIDVKGNWTNTGTFVPQQGLVTFTGTSLQSMTSTTVTPFYDITFNNVAGINAASGQFTVTDALLPQNGTLSINPATTFTLLSDATRTARIAQAGAGAAITGNMTIQRYISGRAAGYSDIGAPVTATTFQDWDNELQLSYAFNPPSAYPSAYSYSETLFDFVPVTSASTAVTPGKGFEVWLDSYFTWITFDPTTVTSIGNPCVGNVNMSSYVTNANDGWNLVANPYASHISLDALIASSSQIASTILFYDENISDYAPLSTGSGVTLAPHQGFWVQATGGSPSFIFQESHKTNATGSSFRSMADVFTLRLSNPSSPVKLNSHSYFTFNQQASEAHDEMDVTYRGVPHPVAPHIYSVCGRDITDRLRTNVLPSDQQVYEIALMFTVGEESAYKLDVLNASALEAEGITCAWLVNENTGETFNLVDENEVELFLTKGGHPEFKLVLQRNGNCNQPVAEKNMNVNFIQTSPKQGKITIASVTEFTGAFAIFSLTGEQLQPWVNVVSAGDYRVELPYAAGMYIVKYSEGSYEKTFKVVVPE